MRLVMVAAVFVLSACASEHLASAPPAGVDLSGHWKLNDADSDDAQRLMQAQLTAATGGSGPGTTTAGQGGRNGRGGGGLGPGGPAGPQMPAVSLLAEGLRWPGRDLAVTQAGETVTFAADGGSRSCRSGDKHPPSHHGSSRNDPSHGRDSPPAVEATRLRRGAAGMSAPWWCNRANRMRIGRLSSSASAYPRTASGCSKW